MGWNVKWEHSDLLNVWFLFSHPPFFLPSPPSHPLPLPTPFFFSFLLLVSSPSSLSFPFLLFCFPPKGEMKGKKSHKMLELETYVGHSYCECPLAFYYGLPLLTTEVSMNIQAMAANTFNINQQNTCWDALFNIAESHFTISIQQAPDL